MRAPSYLPVLALALALGVAHVRSQCTPNAQQVVIPWSIKVSSTNGDPRLGDRFAGALRLREPFPTLYPLLTKTAAAVDPPRPPAAAAVSRRRQAPLLSRRARAVDLRPRSPRADCPRSTGARRRCARRARRQPTALPPPPSPPPPSPPPCPPPSPPPPAPPPPLPDFFPRCVDQNAQALTCDESRGARRTLNDPVIDEPSVLSPADYIAAGGNASLSIWDPNIMVRLCTDRCLYAGATHMTVRQRPTATCECWANCTVDQQVSALILDAETGLPCPPSAPPPPFPYTPLPPSSPPSPPVPSAPPSPISRRCPRPPPSPPPPPPPPSSPSPPSPPSPPPSPPPPSPPPAPSTPPSSPPPPPPNEPPLPPFAPPPPWYRISPVSGTIFQIAAEGDDCTAIVGTGSETGRMVSDPAECEDFGTNVLSEFTAPLQPFSLPGGLPGGQPQGCYVTCGGPTFDDCANTLDENYGYTTNTGGSCSSGCRQVCAIVPAADGGGSGRRLSESRAPAALAAAAPAAAAAAAVAARPRLPAASQPPPPAGPPRPPPSPPPPSPRPPPPSPPPPSPPPTPPPARRR